MQYRCVYHSITFSENTKRALCTLDAKNKPGSLVSSSIGYFEFSNGAVNCDKMKHNNGAYKTYALKNCPAPPKKPSLSINPDDFTGVKVLNDKSILSLGTKQDVMLARMGDGKVHLDIVYMLYLICVCAESKPYPPFCRLLCMVLSLLPATPLPRRRSA